VISAPPTWGPRLALRGASGLSSPSGGSCTSDPVGFSNMRLWAYPQRRFDRAIAPHIGPDIPRLMQENPIQTLEVRADEQNRAIAITAVVTADASRAIFVALSEQLDRHRRQPTESVEDLLVLREQQSLVERFAPLAAAGAHAIVRFTESELRACLLDLTDYTERVDREHFPAGRTARTSSGDRSDYAGSVGCKRDCCRCRRRTAHTRRTVIARHRA
jgi:hypothetical protein